MSQLIKSFVNIYSKTIKRH